MLEIPNLFSDPLGIVANLRKLSQAKGTSNNQQLGVTVNFNIIQFHYWINNNLVNNIKQRITVKLAIYYKCITMTYRITIFMD